MARYKPNSKQFEYIKSIMRKGVNEAMLLKQDIDEAGADRIAELHTHRHFIVESMGDLDPENEVAELRRRAAHIEEIEFALQREWGYPEDKNWHSWWWAVPHCLCPDMDNRERIGTPYAIVNSACPVHGFD